MLASENEFHRKGKRDLQVVSKWVKIASGFGKRAIALNVFSTLAVLESIYLHQPSAAVKALVTFIQSNSILNP